MSGVRPVRIPRPPTAPSMSFTEWLMALDVHKAIEALKAVGMNEAKAIATVRKGLGITEPQEPKGEQK